MITGSELKEKAREYGVPISTIERDYAQNWLLNSFSGTNMALKGGTGIRKAYISEYRFSDRVLYIFLKKCGFKDVKIDVKDLEDRRDDFKNAWENSLKHQLKNLPEFDEVFSSVLEGVSKMYTKVTRKVIGGKNERH